jgi:hypothetical protein
MNDQDMLATIGQSSVASWTVYYAPRARQLADAAPGIAFRPLIEPTLAMQMSLALPDIKMSPLQIDLLNACRSIDQPAGPA